MIFVVRNHHCCIEIICIIQYQNHGILRRPDFPLYQGVGWKRIYRDRWKIYTLTQPGERDHESLRFASTNPDQVFTELTRTHLLLWWEWRTGVIYDLRRTSNGKYHLIPIYPTSYLASIFITSIFVSNTSLVYPRLSSHISTITGVCTSSLVPTK